MKWFKNIYISFINCVKLADLIDAIILDLFLNWWNSESAASKKINSFFSLIHNTSLSNDYLCLFAIWHTINAIVAAF